MGTGTDVIHKDITITMNREDAKRLAEDLNAILLNEDAQWEDNGHIYAPHFAKQFLEILEFPGHIDDEITFDKDEIYKDFEDEEEYDFQNPLDNIVIGEETQIWDFRSGRTFNGTITDKLHDIDGEYGEPGDYFIYYKFRDLRHHAIWDEKRKRWEDDEY